ncbi:hypothetical protein ACO0QE_003176 [Hanseniaspora vineae]
MSTQSGILGSKELLDHILNNDEQNIIISRIREVSGSENSGTNSIQLFQTLEQIDDLYYFIKTFEDCAEQPLYVLIPHSLIDPSSASSANASGSTIVYDLVTYVPDCAPIRNKMLYASSKLNLQRQIGGSKINKNIMLTSLDELRHDNLVEDLKDEDVEELQKQDRQEQDMVVKLKKQQMTSNAVYANPNTTNASKLTFQIIDTNNDLDKFFNGASTENNFIKLVIDTKDEVIKVLDLQSVQSKSEVASHITEISYNIYRDGNDFYFIYACPSGSRVKERMLYASSRQGCIKHLIQTYSSVLQEFVRIIEIGDPEDLHSSDLSPDYHAHDETETDNMRRFNRPKGPPRRR